MRLFIAIQLPTTIQDDLSAVQEELKRALRTSNARLTWVRPAIIHLTLRFFADVKPHHVETIEDVVEQIGAQLRPFQVQVSGVGMFPALGPPRVIWAGVNDTSHIIKGIVQRLDMALAEHGFAPEERAFHPHITLGRIKSAEDFDGLRNTIQSTPFVASSPLTVRHLALLESFLTPRGPCYTPLLTTRSAH
jgi:RNA 2',3'-cyclic 3'-phosphodiesterase